MDIVVKHTVREDLIALLEDIYIVGKRLIKDYTFFHEFFDNVNRTRTLIIHNDCDEHWLKIEFDLANLYEMDEFLRLITEQFQTMAILGYKQTTSGDGRFAVFENGKLIRSVVQLFSVQEKGRIADNYGRKFPFEAFYYPKPAYHDIPDTAVFSYYDDVVYWFNELGFTWKNNSDAPLEYYHLEIVDFKN